MTDPLAVHPDAGSIALALRPFSGAELAEIDADAEGWSAEERIDWAVRSFAPHDEELWRSDPENCCSAVKVGQLDRALAGKAAWMSGLRRNEATTRSGAPVIARDLRGLVKVNPIADWTDAQVEQYIADNDVPVNPLTLRGYPSIGCEPCTKPAAGDDPRSGRWAGRAKTECGLHL